MGSSHPRAGHVGAEGEAPEVHKLHKAVAHMARSMGRYGGVLLQAAAAWDGNVFFAGAAGNLTYGSQTSEISAADSFEVASITKMVTATVVMQLVDEGRVQLDEVWRTVAGGKLEAKVKAHVPTWPSERFGDFTVAELLQHTSGLPNYWDDDSDFIKAFEADPDRLWTTWELLSYAAEMKSSCSPQQRGRPDAFSYADTNYLLLGLMVEELDQETLPKIFRRRVFDPAGMSRKDTYCEFLEERPAGAAPLASRYLGKLQITGKKQHSADSFAAGGIVSTAGDLEKFMKALASGKLFPINGHATLQKMMTWIPAKRGTGWWYGLGLMRIDLEDQVGLLSRFWGAKPVGYVWGHEGFGGAFAWFWSSGEVERDLIITGTTNNEGRAYGDLVMTAVQQTRKLIPYPVSITS